MNEFIENDSLVYSPNEPGVQDDFIAQDFRVFENDTAVKSMTHRRQIEILRENKLLLSSLKDFYDF